MFRTLKVGQRKTLTKRLVRWTLSEWNTWAHEEMLSKTWKGKAQTRRRYAIEDVPQKAPVRSPSVIRKVENKGTMRYHFISTRMAKIKTVVTARVAKDMEKLESSHTPSRNIKRCSHFRKVTIWPIYSTPRYISKPREIKRYVHTPKTWHMSGPTATLFLTV